MTAIAVKPLQSQHARNQARWEEIVSDPQYADCHPTEIETDRFGRIVFMPPPTSTHDFASGDIIFHLNRLLGRYALPTLPISTSDGTKVCDVAWMSPERRAGSKARRERILGVAPEIVVEVMSPGNTWAQLLAKGGLYVASGAEEFWVCDEAGKLHFFVAGNSLTPVEASKRCPQFPKEIEG